MRKAFICPSEYIQGEDELLNLGYFVKTFGSSALLIVQSDSAAARQLIRQNAQLSILNLDGELKDLLADTCDTPGLKMSGTLVSCVFEEGITVTPDDAGSGKKEFADDAAERKNGRLSLSNLYYMVDRMSECIIRNEVPFCELDSYAGDGAFALGVIFQDVADSMK